MLFKNNSFAECTHLGVIQLSGPDAQRYLQGQLSCNVDTLLPGKLQYGLYCNGQGRVIATFHLFKANDDFLLILPRNNVEHTLKALQKYARFSKLSCEDISQDWLILGLWGPSGEQTATQLAAKERQAHVLWDANTQRAMLCGSADSLQDLKPELLTMYSEHSEEAWRMLDIQTGIATIDANTRGSFLPHRLNCHLTDAIDFNKGCFLGQEIIARMHYRAKRKHAMYRVALDTTEALTPDESLYSPKDQLLAEVVSSVCWKHHCEALVIMPIKDCEVSEAYTQDGTAITLTRLDLPYTLEERINHD